MLRRRLEGTGEFIWRVGNAPKFLIPVQVTEPVTRSRSDGGRDRRPAAHGRGAGRRAAGRGRRHPPEDGPRLRLARRWARGDGAGQAAAGHAGRARRDLSPPAARSCCATGQPSGARAARIRAEGNAQPKPLHELRARDQALAMAAAEFVVNTDWSRDDWWPGPTRCAALSATPASRSGSGSRAVGQGHQSGHGREGLARRHPG